MSDAGIPLRVIQEVSGHRNLEELQKYLEVGESQVLGAVASLSMLSPINDEVGKCIFDDIDSPGADEKPSNVKRSHRNRKEQ